MSSEPLLAALQELDSLLAVHPFAVRQLRPPAAAGVLDATAEKLGIEVPDAVRVMYGWHDGAVPEQGGWQLFLFPRHWQYMTLAMVADEGGWARTYCRIQGAREGFPIAKHGSGAFLVVTSDPEEELLNAVYDGVGPAEPDGTLLGMVRTSIDALSGRHLEYEGSFSDTRMEWVYPDRDELD